MSQTVPVSIVPQEKEEGNKIPTLSMSQEWPSFEPQLKELGYFSLKWGLKDFAGLVLALSYRQEHLKSL
ncbi:MAG: hypothetical protein PHN89_03845 [Candidatus Pacebacteria bacterium]|nr:hypothetical protein [Candidatus Paceibacterota bacterium]